MEIKNGFALGISPFGASPHRDKYILSIYNDFVKSVYIISFISIIILLL